MTRAGLVDALNAATGAVVWQTQLPYGIVGSNPGEADVSSPAGALLWRFQTEYTGPASNQGDEDVGAGPTISAPGVNGFPDGVVYINGKDGVEYALDLLTGQQTWSFDMNAYLGSQFYNEVSEAALVGDTIYVGFQYFVLAFNATTGTVVWQTQVEPTTTTTRSVSRGVSGLHRRSPALRAIRSCWWALPRVTSARCS